jgi:hypothetical protein
MSDNVGKVEFAPLSESERRAEIDMRVGARLAEREVYRQQYVNGFLDCFYVLAAIAWVVYIAWFWNREKEN